MAVKYFCDRCGKELDGENYEYSTIRIFTNKNKTSNSWEFCEDCILSVERSMIKSISDYENNNNKNI